MKLTVVQPPYYAGDNPDKTIAEFLTQELEKAETNSLILLPEYSNAGGLSDAESEKKAMSRAKEMLGNAARIAKNRMCYVAINVLEERAGDIKNSTYLFGKDGKLVFVYDKIHLPPSEIALGVIRGEGACVCEIDNIRFGFMTCYDVYFNEQIEFIAKHLPDIILIPGYQRGERTDIIRAQAKLAAFRCNAYIVRSSYSMNDAEHGGCSMIVAPDGRILKDMGKSVGSITVDVMPNWKYMRTAGFGGSIVRNDEFIGKGLCSEIFSK